MNINERFVHIRKFTGLNKKEYADFLGITPTVVSGIETGLIEPSKDVLLRIYEKQNVNIHWLLTGEGDPFSTKKEDPLLLELKKTIKDETSALEARISRIEKQLQNNQDEVNDDFVATEYTPEYNAMSRIRYVEDIAAGIPIEQSNDPDEFISIPKKYLDSDPGNYYAACVKGDSMTEAGIKDGSVILIKKASVPIHNAIQLVRYKNKATLKRMKQTKKGLWELCFEDGSKKIITATSDAYEVQGDFIAVLPGNCKKT